MLMYTIGWANSQIRIMYTIGWSNPQIHILSGFDIIILNMRKISPGSAIQDDIVIVFPF